MGEWTLVDELLQQLLSLRFFYLTLTACGIIWGIEARHSKWRWFFYCMFCIGLDLLLKCKT